jgi:ABC-2 type transport system ATP-binding protein
LHARLWGVAADHATGRIGELVEAVGLVELIDRPVSSYSGGQRRRLEIARALVSRPRVLFLDEPTVGLDPRIRHELLDVIAGLRTREEMTIVLTTHYLDEAQRLCDRVAIIHEGAIVALDSPTALLAGLGREILEFRVSGSPEAALTALRERRVAGPDAFAVGARVTVPLHEHTAADALAVIDGDHLRVSEIATRIPTLDDVYLHVTGERMASAA